eukprot:c27409_g4_i1 orf=506-997(+)
MNRLKIGAALGAIGYWAMVEILKDWKSGSREGSRGKWQQGGKSWKVAMVEEKWQHGGKSWKVAGVQKWHHFKPIVLTLKHTLHLISLTYLLNMMKGFFFFFEDRRQTNLFKFIHSLPLHTDWLAGRLPPVRIFFFTGADLPFKRPASTTLQNSRWLGYLLGCT